MNKLYNTQKEFTSNISKFLKKSFPNIRKTQLNIIPPIIFGMINSNSSSSNHIAAHLKLEELENFLIIHYLTLILFIKLLVNVIFPHERVFVGLIRGQESGFPTSSPLTYNIRTIPRTSPAITCQSKPGC